MVYAKTYQEVKELLTKLKNAAVRVVSSGKVTVGELIREWLNAVKLKVKPSTFACYDMKVSKHILPEFGGVVYEKLTTGAIHDFIHGKIESGLSSKYVGDIVIVFKSMARYIAKVHGYANPLENVIMPKKEETAKRLLTKPEQERLCKYVMANPDSTNIGVMLSYYAGLRIGEVCGLKWCDIDLNKGILKVERTVQRVYENGATRVMTGTPKSKSSVRSIPLPEFVTRVLKQFKTNGSDYVLSGADKPVEPRTLQYRFKALLQKINLPSVNYHSLRHMFATNCIELGFDVKTLSEILGHSTAEITLNRYVHSSMERKAACMNLLKVA